MNILVLTPLYVAPDIEGLKTDTRAVHDLVRPLTETDDVRVFFLYQHPFHDCLSSKAVEMLKRMRKGIDYYANNVPVHLCEIIKAPKQVSLRQNHAQVLYVRNQLTRYLKETDFRPDVLVCHVPLLFEGMLSKWMGGIKKIGIIHAADKLYLDDYSEDPRFLRSFDTLYARSKHLRDSMKSEYNLRIRNELVFSGIDVKIASFARKIPDKGYRVLYAGKLIARKNVNLIIESFISEFDLSIDRLDIIGEGPCEKDLRSLARRYSTCDAIRFHGRESHERVIEAMSMSDIFIMPSVKETLGLVYIEAMSQGCITIGSKNEGADGMIVDGVNGILAEPTLKGVRDSFLRVKKLDSFSYSRLSMNAIETARNLTQEKASVNYRKLMLSGLELSFGKEGMQHDNK